MKIWKKNFFYTMVIIMATMIASITFFYILVPIYYQHKQSATLGNELSDIIGKIEKRPIKDTVNYLKNNFNNTNWILTDDQGNQLYAGELIKWSKEEEEASIDTFDIVNSSESPIEAERVVKEFVDNKGDKYLLSGFTFTQPIIEASSVMLELIPVILIITLIIGTIATYVYSRSSAKRILSISETTNKMVKKMNVACDISGKDELAGLAKDINLLNSTLKSAIEALEVEISKVEEIERNKEYFVQSAAHELKTPITIMSGIVEGMRLNVGRYQDREKYLEICQELLSTQQNLIHNILSVYKAEHFSEQGIRTYFSLKKVVEDLIEPYQIISETNKKKFVLNLNEVSIEANNEQVERLLSNIITNAYQYCKDDGEIYITLNNNCFSIENSCEPLESEFLDKIFEPFYRPDYARNRKSGGTGLGLFIVKQILNANNYPYSFTPNDEQNGMIFIIEFKENHTK
ncbi:MULTISPECIES: HAMP domain-containing sensor histidine kinase [unclassified Enterococcus]|uniref:sensor histidine kinase n=1 Tax=unclassified Enterococcus TaxID=2608891 RepID=UPI001551D67C|nr:MULTISPECIES: HAMP domain-containing sensor histidine kinase [unclassified Enterococcus]MBS7577586.1 HAMP domain-containing histidine kinase [Enterococcus sp. MMGLQ5-2]MBS7584915.1 HAMP domain-containing histidine kinase [Enterococcus sp. MMGLQ5-1]NPD12770.1 HAMP domain-containing histidine kinase [Enterococcus sp. MMGLQ5-1]NPD37419.1 HAMP domain-containing histidine kinase [Enterococcus sp. MMGLQ5-2]